MSLLFARILLLIRSGFCQSDPIRSGPVWSGPVRSALRCAIDGKEEDFGFTLVKRANRRNPAKMITHFDFADDIALASDTAERAALLLTEVDHHCRRISLQLNAKKTQDMAFNSGDVEVKTLGGTKLKVVQEFKYLGAWIASSAKNIKVMRALAWSALHIMKRI